MCRLSVLSDIWNRLNGLNGWYACDRLGFSGVCVLCRQYYKGSDAICEACYAYFKPLPSACPKCALPVSKELPAACRNCATNTLAFDQTIVAYCFEEPLRTLLLRYKYQGALYFRSIFIRLMKEALTQAQQPNLKTEFLIPVPLHIKRLRKRGFNQAAEFTKILGKHYRIPYSLHACKRLNLTSAQVNSTADQRRQNLLNAFSIKPLPYHHVTLVDDVMTTGSTAHALARILKAQGVKTVSVWCCARTVPIAYR